MKKILKWIMIVIISLFAILLVTIKIVSEKKPTVDPSPLADNKASEMLKALHIEAWDTLKYLKWTFADRHHYLWDKRQNKAEIKWDNIVVYLDLNKVDGIVYVDGAKVEDNHKSKYIQKAWSYWCNDSFWMFAPFKVFDPGTQRSLITDADGNEGLMISYSSGGVTPGDCYVWYLDGNNIPTHYKMWVKIIPIGGLKATWDKWTTLPSGAKVATFHDLGIFKMKMADVKEGSSFVDFGLNADPFLEI